MRYENGLFIALSFLLLCFPACKSPKAQGPGPDNVVVIVNGEPITEDDLYLAMNNVHEREETLELRSKAVENLIDQELLYQHGIKLGLDKDPKYQNMVRIMEMRIRQFKRAEMARRVASTRIAASVDVREDDVRKYFALHKSAISRDFRFLVVQFTEEKAARDADQKLKQGATFEAMASGIYAALPAEKRSPRDSGFLHWYQIPPEWVDALSAMNKGEVTGVLAGPPGSFCIIKLVDTKKNTEATWEAMNARIANRVRDVLISRAYERYIQDLRKESKIVKHQERGNSS